MAPVRPRPTPIPQRVHLVGIGGMHMSAIARILLARGHQVSGSDLRPTPLTDLLVGLGATVYTSHEASNVGRAELVVTTSAAPADNPELGEARRRGLPLIKRAEMVAQLMEGKYAIAVAGTHGKTTTTGLIAYMVERAGREPTYLVGGELVDLHTNAAAGGGPHIVVEADEVRRAFLRYPPRPGVVANLEPGPPGFFRSFQG